MPTAIVSRRPLTAGLLLLFGGAAAAAVAWGIRRSNAAGADPNFAAVSFAALVLAYVALGVHTWWVARGSRLGLKMVAVGLLAAAAAITYSSKSVPFTLGRLITAGLAVYLAYVLLCFPRDRLQRSSERRLIGGFLVATAVLWGVTLAVAQQLPAGGAFYDCRSGSCPDNAARFLPRSAAATTASVYSVDVVTTVALVAVAVLIALKCMSPSRLRRRALVPLAICVGVWVVGRSLYVFFRQAGVESGVTVIRPTVAAVAIALPVAMFIGQRRGGLLAARRLATFVAAIGREDVNPAGLQSFMREALGDPQLRFLLWSWDHNGYIDVEGSPAQVPTGRHVQVDEIADPAGRAKAAVVYDIALSDSTELVDGIAKTSLLILDNNRLVLELAASRARIADAAATERMRLERDLHDGAQQRLIGLKLILARLKNSVDAAVADQLDGAMHEADAAIDGLRTVSQGIYPSALVEGGLARALRSVAGSTRVEVQVNNGSVGRSSDPIEYAVYLCALEAIQNALKHGGSGVRVRVDLEARDEQLRFSISDDGAGFDLAATGRRSGLVNMRDRIGSVGGALSISSSVGAGTTVSGVVPFPSADRPRP